MLTASDRKRVAEACMLGTDWRIWRWEPERDFEQWKSLAHTVAQLIRDNFPRYLDKMPSFIAAIANNNVPEIESLCAELISHE